MRPSESFVSQPIRSLQTMLRVIAENDSSIPTVVPDGIYGQSTMVSVSAFQRNHGLPVTGITDQATWDAVVATYESALILVDQAEPIPIIINPGMVYRLGDTGPNILLMQCMLTFLSQRHTSIPAPSMSGTLDAPTADALSALQLLANLPQTGELDKITWKYLVKLFSLNANQKI